MIIDRYSNGISNCINSFTSDTHKIFIKGIKRKHPNLDLRLGMGAFFSNIR